MVRITLTLLLCVVAGYPGRPVAAAHLAEPALDALRVALSFDEPCAVKRSLAESDLSEFTEKEALWASPAALADAFILESLVGMRRPLRNANFAPTTAVYIAGGLAALVLALVVMFGVRLGTLKIEEFWGRFPATFLSKGSEGGDSERSGWGGRDHRVWGRGRKLRRPRTPPPPPHPHTHTHTHPPTHTPTHTHTHPPHPPPPQK
jgi:hypothetical protein